MRNFLAVFIILFVVLSLLNPFPRGLAQTDVPDTIPSTPLQNEPPMREDDLPPKADWYNLPPSAFVTQVASLPVQGVRQVVGGLSHTCVLTNFGGVKCWGDAWEGKLGNGSIVNSYTPVDVYGLSEGVVSIAGTHKHTCALTSEGAVKCWGRNWHGELGDGSTDYRVTPVTPLGLSQGVKAIAAGGFHTCALMVDGTLRCWGANWHGQVGDGTIEERHTPVEVIELGGKATAIATGKYHTCAILDTTGLRCWGYNKYGQIGNGPEDDALIPTKVAGLKTGVAAVSLGENHSCALMIEKSVVCWGNNQQGQLGLGNTETQYIPVFVAALGYTSSAVYAGQRFTCAFNITDGVYCWGENWAGQLGDQTQVNKLLPVLASALEDKPVSMTAGDSHACAVLDTGGLICWGSNSHGQLGDGTAALRTQPVDVYGLADEYVSVVSGGAHSCALTAQGGVKCWGNNQYGQLGDDTTITRISPVPVYGLDHGVLAIAAGSWHSCAMTSTQILCWGNNAYGQLGNGSRINFSVPVAVVGINHPPIKLAAGTNHNCAIQDNGIVKCWGYNRNGQLGLGTRTDSTTALAIIGVDGLDFTEVAAGDRHSCSVTNIGRAYCWGLNEDGQLGTGDYHISDVPIRVLGLELPVVDMALGFYHSCAILDDKSLRCWGNNLYGQLGDGTTNEYWLPHITQELGAEVLQLSASGYQTCAILTGSNDLLCWGYNQSGQLGDGTTFTRLSPVSVSGLKAAAIGAGSQSTCAISAENSLEGFGQVKCWGSNTWGQVGDSSLPWSLEPILVRALLVPTLGINYPTGYPGSFFTVTGTNFDLDSGVKILVNNLPINSALTTDENGELVFILDTALADPGGYVVSVQAGKTSNVVFHLDLDAPLHVQEDIAPIFQVPSGIAFDWTLFLPWGSK